MLHKIKTMFLTSCIHKTQVAASLRSLFHNKKRKRKQQKQQLKLREKGKEKRRKIMNNNKRINKLKEDYRKV